MGLGTAGRGERSWGRDWGEGVEEARGRDRGGSGVGGRRGRRGKGDGEVWVEERGWGMGGIGEDMIKERGR